MGAAAAKKQVTQGDSKKPLKEVNVLNPPEEFIELPKPEQVKSPYPVGVQFFSYQPKDGSDPILLAINGFDNPDKLWFFDLAQLPKLSQTWRWMDKAGVPKAIQRRAQSLPDEEYFGMLDEWFETMTKYRQAGPKGAVTVGK